MINPTPTPKPTPQANPRLHPLIHPSIRHDHMIYDLPFFVLHSPFFVLRSFSFFILLPSSSLSYSHFQYHQPTPQQNLTHSLKTKHTTSKTPQPLKLKLKTQNLKIIIKIKKTLNQP